MKNAAKFDDSAKVLKLIQAGCPVRGELIFEVLQKTIDNNACENQANIVVSDDADVTTGATCNPAFEAIVYIYGIWLNGCLRYVGSSRNPCKRFHALRREGNDMVKSVIAQGGRLVVLQVVPELGSERVEGRIIKSLKRFGGCDCNCYIPKTDRNRDVTWRGRMRVYNDEPNEYPLRGRRTHRRDPRDAEAWQKAVTAKPRLR